MKEMVNNRPAWPDIPKADDIVSVNRSDDDGSYTKNEYVWFVPTGNIGEFQICGNIKDGDRFILSPKMAKRLRDLCHDLI